MNEEEAAGQAPVEDQLTIKKGFGASLFQAFEANGFTFILVAGSEKKPLISPTIIAYRKTQKIGFGDSAVQINSAAIIRHLDKSINLYSDGTYCDFANLPLVTDKTFHPRPTKSKDGVLHKFPIGKPLLNSEGTELLRLSQSSIKPARALCQKWLTDPPGAGDVSLWVLMPVVFVDRIILINESSKATIEAQEIVVFRNHSGVQGSILLVPEKAIGDFLKHSANKLDLSSEDLKLQLDKAADALSIKTPDASLGQNGNPVPRWLAEGRSIIPRLFRWIRNRPALLFQLTLATLSLYLLAAGLIGYFCKANDSSSAPSNYIQLIVAGATLAYVLVTYWLLAESIRQRALAAMPCIGLRYRWIGFSSDGTRNDRTKRSTRIVNVGNGPCYIDSFKWNLLKKDGQYQILGELVEAKSDDMGVVLGKFTGDEAQEISFVETKMDQMWYTPLADSRVVIEILYYDVQGRRYQFALRNLQQHTSVVTN